MKKLLLAGALAFSFHSFAQTPQIPEFKDKVMFVEASGNLAELDRTDLSSDLHTSMSGHSEVNLVAKGKNSSVTHSGAPSEKYIVKIDAGVDPSGIIELFKFDVGKKNRKILVAEMSMGRDKTVELTKAKISFKKVADGVYEINPTSQLESGEYAFLVKRPNISILGAANSQSLSGFCFGVQ